MAISIVQTTPQGATSSDSSTSQTVTFVSSVTAGNAILVSVSGFLAGSSASHYTVTDNKSNTYVCDAFCNASSGQIVNPGTTTTPANAAWVGVWRCASVATGGSSFTITVTASVSSTSSLIVAAQEVSGLVSNPVNVTKFNNTTTGTTSQSVGSFSTTDASCLLIAGMSCASITTFTVTSSQSGSWASFNTQSGKTINCDMDVEIVSTTQSSINPAWTTSVSAQYAALAIAYLGGVSTSGPSYGTASDYGGGNPGGSFTSGNGSWTNPTNADALDGSFATNAPGNGDTTNALEVTGLGFSIPASSTINGIAVTLTGKISNVSRQPFENVIQLLKAGSLAGTAIVDNSQPFTTTNASINYGGAVLWGTTWSYSDINNSSFGVLYQGQNFGGNGTLSIDAISITVFYTPPALGAPTSVTATLQTDGTTLLSYTQPSGTVTQNVFQFSTDGGSTWSGALTPYTAATSVVVETIHNPCTRDTAFDWQVAAIDGSTQSAWSSSASVTTGPAAPTSLAVTCAANPVATWTNPTPTGGATLTDNVIQYSTDMLTWNSIDCGSVVTSYTMTTLTAATLYYFRVSAVDTNGQGYYTGGWQSFYGPAATFGQPWYTYAYTGLVTTLTTTLEPTGPDIALGGWTNVGGASSLGAALSDNSDSTYGVPPGPGGDITPSQALVTTLQNCPSDLIAVTGVTLNARQKATGVNRASVLVGVMSAACWATNGVLLGDSGTGTGMNTNVSSIALTTTSFVSGSLADPYTLLGTQGKTDWTGAYLIVVWDDSTGAYECSEASVTITYWISVSSVTADNIVASDWTEMAYTNSPAAIDFRAMVDGDCDTIADWTATLEVNGVIPTDATLSLVEDNVVAADSCLSVHEDYTPSASWTEIIDGDCDTIVAWLGIPAHDCVISSDWTLSLVEDNVPAVDWVGGGVAADALTAASWLGGAFGDCLSPIEWASTIEAVYEDVVIAVEILSTCYIDQFAPIEWLGVILVATLDTIPVEINASARIDNQNAAAWTQGVGENVIVPAWWIGPVYCDSIVAVDWPYPQVVLDAVMCAEWGGSAFSGATAVIPASWTGSLYQGSTILVDWLATAASQKTAPADWTSNFTTDNLVPADFTQGLLEDNVVASDFAGGVTNEPVAAADWTANLHDDTLIATAWAGASATADYIMAAAWLANLNIDHATPADWTLSLVENATASVEVTASAYTSPIVATEWAGASYSDSLVPIDVLETAQANYTIAIEELGGTGANATVPAELEATVIWDASTPIDWTSTVLSSGPIPVDFFLTVPSADYVIAVEHLGGVQQNSTIDVDWYGQQGVELDGGAYVLPKRSTTFNASTRGTTYVLPERGTCFVLRE